MSTSVLRGRAASLWLRLDGHGYDAGVDYAFGNAIGNSIVDKSTPKTKQPYQQLADDIDESSTRSLDAWAQQGLDDLANRVPTLSVNPETDFTPGMVSGDRARMMRDNNTQWNLPDITLGEGSYGALASDNGVAQTYAAGPWLQAEAGVDLPASASPTQESGLLSTVGKYTLGGTETLLGGMYNYGVRIAGGLASIPYLADSVDAAVAVQEGFSERYGYGLRSQGAQDIGAALQPVGQYVQNNVLNPLRNYSEAHIGDAATTTLFAGAQAGLEVGGLLLGGGVVGSTERVAAGTGLRTSTVISSERATQYLLDNIKVPGFTREAAQSFVDSFDGPITARISRPSDPSYFRYVDSGAPEGSGGFLTRTVFNNPGETYPGLAMKPEYRNDASLRQTVSATQRSIVFEGRVADGARGVNQTFVINRNAFQYGTGFPYGR